jgi:hypothetical protein
MTIAMQRATRPAQKPAAWTAFWPDTKDRVARGIVTPFISNYMSSTLFGLARGQLAAQWAGDIGSPFGDADNREIAHVAQYYTVTHGNSRLETKQNYLSMLTDYLLGRAQHDLDVDQDLVQEYLDRSEQRGTFGKPFSEIARDLGYPRFDRVEANPFRLLAEMPLPIYITTSHHYFLEYALAQTQNKKPVSEIFYWGDHLENIPSIFDKQPDWVPTSEEPLVYHLYGLDRYPESMVLSEDDFLDLLVRLAELRYLTKMVGTVDHDTSRQRHDLPWPVRKALPGTALLMLGYSVITWEFRVLLKGLVLPYGENREHMRDVPEGISVQIKPGELDAIEGDSDGIRSYLEQYFKNVYFRVYWGSVESCTHDLYDLWQR